MLLRCIVRPLIHDLELGPHYLVDFTARRPSLCFWRRSGGGGCNLRRGLSVVGRPWLLPRPSVRPSVHSRRAVERSSARLNLAMGRREGRGPRWANLPTHLMTRWRCTGRPAIWGCADEPAHRPPTEVTALRCEDRARVVRAPPGRAELRGGTAGLARQITANCAGRTASVQPTAQPSPAHGTLGPSACTPGRVFKH